MSALVQEAKGQSSPGGICHPELLMTLCSWMQCLMFDQILLSPSDLAPPLVSRCQHLNMSPLCLPFPPGPSRHVPFAPFLENKTQNSTNYARMDACCPEETGDILLASLWCLFILGTASQAVPRHSERLTSLGMPSPHHPSLTMPKYQVIHDTDMCLLEHWEPEGLWL